MFRKIMWIPFLALLFLIQFKLSIYATVEYVKEFKSSGKDTLVER